MSRAVIPLDNLIIRYAFSSTFEVLGEGKISTSFAAFGVIGPDRGEDVRGEGEAGRLAVGLDLLGAFFVDLRFLPMGSFSIVSPSFRVRRSMNFF
jgi:hypothetical protein